MSPLGSGEYSAGPSERVQSGYDRVIPVVPRRTGRGMNGGSGWDAGHLTAGPVLATFPQHGR